MSRKVKCPLCNTLNEKENTQELDGRYYCIECAEKRIKEKDKHINGWDELYNYICELKREKVQKIVLATSNPHKVEEINAITKGLGIEFILPPNDFDPFEDHDNDLDVQEAKPKLKRPPLYKVILLNDDFTPMDFVIEVLMDFFGMPEDKATQVMLHIHTRGVGVCGVYTKDVAETKVMIVNEYSREHQHPLLCSMEEA